MSEEWIVALIASYGLGFTVTLLSFENLEAINRRCFLWPLYWVYLGARLLIDITKELRG